MKNFKNVILISVGLFIFMIFSLAQAQKTSETDRIHLRTYSGQQRIQEIYNQLNLTENQKKQLDVIKQQHRATMENVRQRLKINKEALQEELMKTQLDRPKINEIHNQIKILQSQIEDERLSSILLVRAILTPEQFTKFVSLTHKHKRQHEE